ncbi:hypothetical protein P7C70_g4370, partial [Phenoliferia sp. Uapishka_3]
MPVLLHDVCGWTHCRQHIRHNTPGALYRHYIIKHNGRQPPAQGYESAEEEEPHPDAELLNQAFWAAQEQRRRGREEGRMDGVEAGDGLREFVEERFPNAGWACTEAGEFLPERDPQPRVEGLFADPGEPFAPFDDVRQYGWADRISKFRMSKAQVDAHMRRHAEQVSSNFLCRRTELIRPSDPVLPQKEPTEPAFTTFDHYRKKVDQIEYGPEWATWRKLVFKVAPEDLPVDAYTLYPFLEDLQETLDLGTTAVRLTLASDGTTCSMASGNATVHPVYLSTSLNDASLIREDRGALVVVGFTPTLKCTMPPTFFTAQTSNDFISIQARTLHPECARCSRDMLGSILLEPLRKILEADQLRQTADGWWRWCRAYLGCQPVDYPEGGWLLSVFKNWVVCCEARPEQLGDGVGVAHTSESLAAHRALGAVHARSVGLHMEKPFYDKFGIDGHALIIADLLHQLTKGAFKDWTLDTLVKAYLKDACGGGTPYDRVMKEIARRLEVLPPHSNLLRFKTGIEFSQWTGKDSHRGGRLRLGDLEDQRDLPGFAAATSRFLATYFDLPGFEYQGRVETHTVASASFPVYGKPAYLSNDTCQLMNQRIYATRDYPYRGEEGSIRGPRHDTVLVRNTRHAELKGDGFDAYDVMRARLFFTVRYRGRRVELCFGKVFMKVPNHPATLVILQPVVFPVDVAGEPLYRVVLVSDILRTVHLQPLFGKLGVPKDLTFMETLDRWRGSYAVGVFTDQHTFRLLFRPDAARYIRPIPR